MTQSLAINARYRHRRITGVERYAHEITKRLGSPKRFLQPNRPLGQITGHMWEQFLLPNLISKNELLWSPANAGPWSVSDQVITIHDASVFDHPEWFRPTFAAWTRLSWKILAKRAKTIITVSEFSKQRLKHHLGLPDEKIHVVYNGVGKPFEPQSAKCVEDVKDKYGIKKPYFLFVGTLEPRKNLKTLLKAWSMAGLDAHELFISGEDGKVFANYVGHASSASYVSDNDLPALYSGASAFVFPSFYEGFGLPALEAMACGTPVITSSTTALAEVFGDAALLVSPGKTEDIACAMQTIVEDKSFAMKLREKGLMKASEFTWEKSARETEVILRKAST